MKTRKVFVLLLLTVIVLVLLGLVVKEAQYKVVTLGDVGTVKVPKKWVLNIDDDVVYLTDKPISEPDYKLYLFGVLPYESEYEKMDALLKEIFGKGKIYKEEHIESAVYSNSTHYAKYLRYTEDGEKRIIRDIYINTIRKGGDIILWVCDDEVSKKVLVKMAKSFDEFRDEES